MLKYVTIQNFRGIKKLEKLELNNLTLLVGENGTNKTSILEAVNFCLSPFYLPGRIKPTDFYKGEDSEIQILLEFEDTFKIFLPDGWLKQEVICNKIYLEIKRRDKATANKAFSDIVTISHYALPTRDKDNEKGWEITRKNGSIFKFDERLLSFPLETENLPKSFYFPKNREKQLQRGFNSSISSILDDFNWRFNKKIREIETKESFSGEKFSIQKNNFEESILQKIDEKTQEKTFKTLNEKLNEIGLPSIDLSLIDGSAPFDTAFLSQKVGNLDLPISQSGSGIEMAVSLLFLETMAEISKESILILIDEPELHLHPSLQKKLIDHIVSNSSKNQFLLSTHSPLFVKQVLNNESDNFQVHCFKIVDNEVKVSIPEDNVLPYISANEINYIAFGVATEEYHNELYNELETNFWNDINNNFQTLKQNGNYDKDDSRQVVFDNEFFSKQRGEKVDSPYKGVPNKVTKHTYIRNKIHHPKENGGFPKIEDLCESIKNLRAFFL